MQKCTVRDEFQTRMTTRSQRMRLEAALILALAVDIEQLLDENIGLSVSTPRAPRRRLLSSWRGSASSGGCRQDGP